VGADGRVVAVDQHGGKLERLADSLETRPTLGPQVDIRHATLTDFVASHRQQDGDAFDHVLVDAPCSALGTIRRHPEIRWRRREADIPDLVAVQRELLEAAADLVAPGGVLTYAVCTFLSEEANKQVPQFLESHADFELEAPPSDAPIDWSDYCDGDVLTTDPVSHNSDMFFAARMRRNEDSTPGDE
jgi:16S rRNA (cytosine967-C5)-methyltransferase